MDLQERDMGLKAKIMRRRAAPAGYSMDYYGKLARPERSPWARARRAALVYVIFFVVVWAVGAVLIANSGGVCAYNIESFVPAAPPRGPLDRSNELGESRRCTPVHTPREGDRHEPRVPRWRP
jgi:hypothetical protein